MEVITDPDVEQILCDWLPGQLFDLGYAGTVPVGTRVPNPRPPSERFVRLVLNGGAARPTQLTVRPVVVLEGYGSTETAARALLVDVLGLIEAAGRDGLVLDDTQIYSAERVSTPASLPDPLTNLPRYTAMVELHLSCSIRTL